MASNVSPVQASSQARSVAEPRLGFNGELHEPFGWQILGSYRAFNPVLMRFHSPDSLSPFGKGGVNSYAYCLGDPINWVDPDGQSIFSAAWNGIQKLFGKILRQTFMFSGGKVKTVKNYRKIIPGLKVFEDKGETRINFLTHGAILDGESVLYYNSGYKGVSDIRDAAYFAEIDFKKYNSVRLLACHSAEPSRHGGSIGQQVADMSGLPTKAFVGKVTAGPLPFSGNEINEIVVLRTHWLNRDPYMPNKFYPKRARQNKRMPRHMTASQTAREIRHSS